MTLEIPVTIPPPFLYSFRAGYRPPTTGKDALPEGRALIVVPDKVMCFGIGGGAFVELKWGGGSAGGSALPTLYPIAAAASFTASHGLAYEPETWIVDQSGGEVDTDVTHTPGAVTVAFAQPFTGTLYLR